MSETPKTQFEMHDEWKRKFPLCFEREGCCMTFGVEHGAGWNLIVEELLGKIEAHLAEKYAAGHRDPDHLFAVDQIKEKFGTLRFYASCADDTIYNWIDEAERKSSYTCEKCSKPASLHCRKGFFWIHTFCPEHAAEYDYEPYNPKLHDI